MNALSGTVRAALVVAALYWLGAFGLAFVAGYDAYRDRVALVEERRWPIAVHPASSLQHPERTVLVPDGRKVIVRADTQREAVALAYAWAKATPRNVPSPWLAARDAFGAAAADALLYFTGLAALLVGVVLAGRWVTTGFVFGRNRKAG